MYVATKFEIQIHFIKFIQKYPISGAYVPEDKILKNNCLLIMPLRS